MTLTCGACGKAFERKAWTVRSERVFCSRECFHAGRQPQPARRVEAECRVCGKRFSRVRGRHRSGQKDHANSGVYCSLACYRARPMAEGTAERQKARMRAWRQENRDHLRLYKRNRHLAATSVAADYCAILRGDPCSYCGAPAESVDHVQALAVGGSNDWDNLTAACRSCNSRKGQRSLLDFMGIFMAATAKGLPRPLEAQQPWSHSVSPSMMPAIRTVLGLG